MFGLDAMIDEEGRVYLLELNCDPDLKVLCFVSLLNGFDVVWMLLM